MAIYNFYCCNNQCNNEFESIEKIGTELSNCPKCKSVSKRVFSSEGGSFRLKGRCISKYGYEGTSNQKTVTNLE